MKLDNVLKHVISVAKKFSSVEKIILFGSRSKGDFHGKSDYDLAFLWKEKKGQYWGEFSEIVREKNPTLYSFDLVRLDLAGQDLKNKIDTEGIIIYEKGRTKL